MTLAPTASHSSSIARHTALCSSRCAASMTLTVSTPCTGYSSARRAQMRSSRRRRSGSTRPPTIRSSSYSDSSQWLAPVASIRASWSSRPDRSGLTSSVQNPKPAIVAPASAMIRSFLLCSIRGPAAPEEASRRRRVRSARRRSAVRRAGLAPEPLPRRTLVRQHRGGRLYFCTAPRLCSARLKRMKDMTDQASGDGARAPSLLADPAFLRVWLTGGLAGVLRWLELLAISIYVLEATGSPFLVALMTFLRMAPMFLFGIPAGALADRYDRKQLLMIGLLV